MNNLFRLTILFLFLSLLSCSQFPIQDDEVHACIAVYENDQVRVDICIEVIKKDSTTERTSSMKHTPEIKILMTKLGKQLLTLRARILTDGMDPNNAITLTRALCLDIESKLTTGPDKIVIPEPTEPESWSEPKTTEPEPKPKPKKSRKKKQ